METLGTTGGGNGGGGTRNCGERGMGFPHRRIITPLRSIPFFSFSILFSIIHKSFLKLRAIEADILIRDCAKLLQDPGRKRQRASYQIVDKPHTAPVISTKPSILPPRQDSPLSGASATVALASIDCDSISDPNHGPLISEKSRYFALSSSLSDCFLCADSLRLSIGLPVGNSAFVTEEPV